MDHLTTLTWKLHIYHGIYYTWEKTPVPPIAESGSQSFVGMLNIISWGVSL
mgnify:CR=1 FL=1